MNLNKILLDAKMMKELKKDINEDIKNNLDKIHADKLEIFDFMHKVDRLDLMIDRLLDDVKTMQSHNSTASTHNDMREYKIRRKDVDTKIHQSNKENGVTKLYNVEKSISKNDEKISINTVKDEDTHKKDINAAYARIAKLEAVINERRNIEKEEEIIKMKDIHTMEERAEMLEKKHIKAESFTPKAKVQSDQTMDKTVAMSREEFYRELDNSLGDGGAGDLKDSAKGNIEKKADIVNEIEAEDEFYNIYEEEKSGSLLDKFKEFMGK